MKHNTRRSVQTMRGSVRCLRPSTLLAVLAAWSAPWALAAENTTRPSQPAAGKPAQSEPEASLEDAVIPSGIFSPQRPVPAEPPSAEASKTATDQSIFGRETLTGDWWGLRSKLNSMGITPAANFTADSAMNFRGGQNTEGSSLIHLTNVNFTLTPPLLPFEGSTIFISFQTVNGTGPSEDVGDISGASSIDSDGRTQLSEVWYQQVFGEGKLAFTLGKIDAGSIFGIVEPEGYFINSKLGYQDSLPLPTYPDPSFGGYFTVKPTDSLCIDAGLFDGAYQEGYRTGTLGPKTFFDDPSDLFAVGQVTYTATEKLTLGGGTWYHTGTFADQFGNPQDGAYGLYVHAYYQAYRENPGIEDDNQGLNLFIHYDYADSTAIDTPHHFGAGAVWVGALPGRDSDVAGCGMSCLLLRDGPEFSDGNETVFELFYKVQLTPYLSVQPDIQYIANPGGNGASDAIVGLIRLSVDF